MHEVTIEWLKQQGKTPEDVKEIDIHDEICQSSCKFYKKCNYDRRFIPKNVVYTDGTGVHVDLFDTCPEYENTGIIRYFLTEGRQKGETWDEIKQKYREMDW